MYVVLCDIDFVSQGRGEWSDVTLIFQNSSASRKD